MGGNVNCGVDVDVAPVDDFCLLSENRESPSVGGVAGGRSHRPTGEPAVGGQAVRPFGVKMIGFDSRLSVLSAVPRWRTLSWADYVNSVSLGAYLWIYRVFPLNPNPAS